MSHMSDENDSRMIPKDQVGSPSVDESCSGGSLSGGGQALKKGPWTSAEDTILIEYVKKHGEGNWNAVQKHSGLSRCGKSCRLRWANHLRPNLKKGAITQEEEQLIIELHARMGNKWARMAAYLPGRTDNEIKNFWNTRIKRRQRMGLPLYTSSVCFQDSDDKSHAASEYGCSEKEVNELFHGNVFDVADVMFDNFNHNLGTLTYTPPFPDIAMNNSVAGQSFAPQGYGLINPVVDHAKRCRESETLIPIFHDSVSGILPSFEQLPVEPYMKMQRISSLGYPYDPDPDGDNLVPSEGVVSGSHAFINGNFSASKPIHGPVKLELPSLQYSETDGSSSFASPYTPFYEAFETYVESPKLVSLHCESVSPKNSGLLDALVLEAQVMSGSNKQSSEKNSNSSTIIPNSMVGKSDPNISETEWEDYSNPVSPLGCSAASVFKEYTTPISGCSLDVLPHSRAASIEIFPTSEHHTATVEGKNIWRPDALLGSEWLEESSQSSKGHSMLSGALASLLGQDLCTDSKPVVAGTSTALVTGFGLDSYPWHNMPSACQMSEFP